MDNDKDKNKDKDKDNKSKKDRKEEPKIMKDLFDAFFGAFKEGGRDTAKAIEYLFVGSWKIATVGIIIAGSIAYLSGGCNHKYQTLDSRYNSRLYDSNYDLKPMQTIESRVEFNSNHNSAKTLDSYLQNQNYK